MAKTERIILTGAPGTGKTTISHLLKRQGYPVLPEMARALIKEQQELDSDILPWKDHKAFGEVLFRKQVAQFHQAQEGLTTFFDRGIPDNLGYLRRDKIQNKALEKEAEQYQYFPKVFLTPPWEDIYNQDNERWEDFELMLQIHDALMDIYQHFKYQIIEVPRISPANRLDFILEHIKSEH